MKWYKYVLVMILCLVPNIIHAECSNSEIVGYQEQAKNINVTYDYTEHPENNYVSFSIKINNLTPGIYIQDDLKKSIYRYNGEDVVLDNYDYGRTYKFSVYVDGGNCPGRLITTKYVNLPYYNAYYKDPLCKGIEEFRYCQKWARVKNVSYYEFKNAVEKYRKSFDNNNDISKNTSDYGIFKFLFKIYIKYYYIILPVIIVGGYMIIRSYNKKHDLF